MTKPLNIPSIEDEDLTQEFIQRVPDTAEMLLMNMSQTCSN